MLFNYFRIGGVNGDLNHEFMSRLGDWMSRATEQHEANMGLLNENEIFVRRMRDIGRLDRGHRAADGGHRPQPARRGRPVRHPAGAPVQRLPGARVRHPGPRHRAPRAATRSTATCSASTRSSRACGSSTSASTTCPTGRSWPACRASSARGPGRAWAAVEGPRGLYGTYAISDGTDQPFRMKIHDPSFVHLQLVGLLMKGNLIADTMAVMASLDPIMGGIDK